MTLEEEKRFISGMLYDFRLSLYDLKRDHLMNYEIELICERYKIPKKDFIAILNKIYNKEINNLQPKNIEEI